MITLKFKNLILKLTNLKIKSQKLRKAQNCQQRIVLGLSPKVKRLTNKS